MKVLVIPDVHLKPYMFRQASALMRTGIAERAVCLMDLPDDWDRGYDVELYEITMDEAVRFAKEFPDTCWCYGNHDLSYVWNRLETGYSSLASYTVQKKLIDLRASLPEGNEIRYVHRIDNVLFSHGGISKIFVETFLPKVPENDIDAVVEEINRLGPDDMWNDASPIWLRPQQYDIPMYKPRKCLQVVGHTPMKKITKEKNVISCDVFSTYPDRRPIGTREYLLLDTKTWEFQGIPI